MTLRRPLPAALHPLMARVATLLDVPEFVLFGGAAHAMLTPGNPPGGDLT